MDETTKKLVEEYQCPGCVCGSDITCYEKGYGLDCGKHAAGTRLMGAGLLNLGLPKGFNRKGPVEDMSMQIFESPLKGWGYDKWNVPVWKYLDANGNTIVRGLSPRLNQPFLHVFKGDHREDIFDCIEITHADIDKMD